MKRVFLIHRWSGGSSDDWRPWLKVELEKLGFEVIAPSMPDRDTPIIEKWVDHLSKVVGVPDSNTFFVGHSIGCQTILRYLETIKIPVCGAIFVAGWFGLQNLEDEEVRATAQPWINTPIDKKKVKPVLPQSTLLISDNDPYDCFEKNKEGFEGIGTKVVVINGGKHFTGDDGFKEFPQLLSEFRKLQ